MKSILFAVLFFLGSAFLTASFRHDGEVVTIMIATLLGFFIGRMIQLQKELDTLRQIFADDWDLRHAKEQETDSSGNKGFDSASSPAGGGSKQVQVAKSTVTEKAVSKSAASKSSGGSSAQAEPVTSVDTQPTSGDFATSYSTSQTGPTAGVYSDKALSYLKNYFSGGNLFVRIGIIVLFFGVSFLLKYVSERGLFPIEYRLSGVVIAAIGLLALGWRLRHKKQTYALLLQGAGVGILYLAIYAAFAIYHLIPPTPAFLLLVLVGLLSAALAVLQNARSLAVLGFSGGFLAPVLASSGSDNHVLLFSYYLVLNIAIVAIAWFKAWRPLNLLGFVFTFIIGTSWGVFRYSDDKFITTEPFLILFFLFYVLIAVLFALRQPPRLRGYVDGTLLFGVPLAASGLQYALVKDYEYGVALSSFAMGAFYLLLSWLLWMRQKESLKLLSEAFLALGVIFSSLAIPFALAPTKTAGAWAIEGIGLLWLGTRQNRLAVRLFGLLLQLGGGFFVFVRQGALPETAFINGFYISTLMMALAGLVSARLLDRPYDGRASWEKALSPVLLVWGLLWLFGGFMHQLSTYYHDKWLPGGLLLFAALVALVFILLAPRLKPVWQGAWFTVTGLLPVMLLVVVMQLIVAEVSGVAYHPFYLNGWLAWPVAFAVFYWILYTLENKGVLQGIQSYLHGISLLLLVMLLTFESVWQIEQVSGRFDLFAHDSDWLKIVYAIPATVALYLVIRQPGWPLTAAPRIYRYPVSMALAAFIILWGFYAVTGAGKSAPLFWLPLLNPADIMLGIAWLVLLRWWSLIDSVFRSGDDAHKADPESDEQRRIFNRRAFALGIAVLAFFWLNFTLFRIAHHWFDVQYTVKGLYDSSLVQSAVSIVWSGLGVVLTVTASRRQNRTLWVAGSILLLIVVLKLFVIDLSELSKFARIISFLVVGVLLTSIGYFAPLPDKQPATEAEKGQQ